MLRFVGPTPTLVLSDPEGPGRDFNLNRPVTSIGRSSKNDVVLTRMSVSRRHAQIVCEAGRYYFEDLASDSGSRVDSRPVSGRVLLRDGSVIEISRYALTFRDPSFHIDEDSESMILGTVDLPSSTNDPRPLVKPEETLRHVLELTRNLGDTLRLDAVLDRALETLFHVFPQADRAFVVLKEGDQVDAAPRAIKYRGDPTGACVMSRTVFNLVMNEGKAILSADVPMDSRLAQAKSVHDSHVRTMLCVPLLDPQHRPRGILQLDAAEDRPIFVQDDLDLLAAVAVLIGVAVDNARLHAEQIERTETEVEERDARQVQLAFLPDDPPAAPGYSFWHRYEPARFVGGDYFDYHPGPADAGAPARRWLIALGDVVGKGMPAALLMARLSAEVRLLAQSGLGAASIVERLNRDFCRPGIEPRYITLLLVLLDAERHRITVVSAGHMGPILRRADGRVEIVGEEAAAYPIGIEPCTAYRASDAVLAPGDAVVLYTDGVNEVLSPDGRVLGTARLMEAVRRGLPDSAALGETIINSVREHAAGRPLGDDVTLICFTRL